MVKLSFQGWRACALLIVGDRINLPNIGHLLQKPDSTVPFLVIIPSISMKSNLHRTLLRVCRIIYKLFLLLLSKHSSPILQQPLLLFWKFFHDPYSFLQFLNDPYSFSAILQRSHSFTLYNVLTNRSLPPRNLSWTLNGFDLWSVHHTNKLLRIISDLCI